MSLINPYYYQGNLQLKVSKGRRKFTPQEDEKLRYLFSKIGNHNWVKISELMPGRTAKQCRDRFCNYLSEPHNTEPWKPEEDEILLSYLYLIGPKWVEISRHIERRSGNDVKNRWYKHLCKKYGYLRDKCFKQPKMIDMNDLKPIANGEICYPKKLENESQKYTISALLI